VTAGIFCNAEGLKASVGSNIFGKVDDSADFLGSASPARNKFKCQGKFGRILEGAA
jgi:hypothetical protein